MEIPGHEDDREKVALIQPDKLCPRARGVMTEHLSPSSLERFPDHSVAAESLLREVRHLEVCPDCHEAWRRARAAQRGRDPAALACSPDGATAGSGSEWRGEPGQVDGARPDGGWPDGVTLDWGRLDWLVEEHLTSTVMSDLIAGQIDADEREMAELHLRGCLACHQQLLMQAPIQAVWSSRSRRLALILAVVMLLPVLSLLACLAYYAQPAAGPTSPTPTAPAGPTTPAGPLRNLAPPDHLAVAAPAIPTIPPTTGPTSLRPLPTARRAEAGPMAITLRDGGRIITLDRKGRLTGLPEVSRADRRWMARTLQRRILPDPGIADLLGGEPHHHRSKAPPRAGSEPSLRLRAPLASVIVTTSPHFEWEPESTVTSWGIELTEQDGAGRLASPLLASPLLDGWRVCWSLPAPLPRGSTWRVTLRAWGPAGELPATTRVFRILGDRELARFEKLGRNSNSNLARGLLAAHLGLIPEAVAAFRQLDAENADNLLIKRFLLQLLAESGP